MTELWEERLEKVSGGQQQILRFTSSTHVIENTSSATALTLLSISPCGGLEGVRERVELGERRKTGT